MGRHSARPPGADEVSGFSGLGNMHRCARDLGGLVKLDQAPGYALLTLNLPTNLTEA